MRDAENERPSDPRLEPGPRPEEAASDGDPRRVEADRQVHQLEAQVVDELADQLLQLRVGVGGFEDGARRESLARSLLRRRGEADPARNVLEELPFLAADVSRTEQAVADLAGRTVRAEDDLSADHQRGREPGADVDVERGIVTDERPEAHLGSGGGLDIGRQRSRDSSGSAAVRSPSLTPSPAPGSPPMPRCGRSAEPPRPPGRRGDRPRTSESPDRPAGVLPRRRRTPASPARQALPGTPLRVLRGALRTGAQPATGEMGRGAAARSRARDARSTAPPAVPTPISLHPASRRARSRARSCGPR